ncbi:hypothetical protein ARMGADRAFT_929032 [Armillaria gallica]|uniref:Chromo domain-containing protein n=1 Tax=Armillaria gallica TaxID=47427 RepID=A0A2H3DE48_ARMGA|nr:hypothetical protein ARMGADRAFT_929032 [Armillaria gallica]
MFKLPGRHRHIKKYRVHFKGLPSNEDEWKTLAELKNAPLVLHKWRNGKGTLSDEKEVMEAEQCVSIC